MVYWDIEETLNLVGMEIHGDNAVNTGSLKHIGDEFGCDWHMGLVFAVLTCKTIIRNNGDNLLG